MLDIVIVEAFGSNSNTIVAAAVEGIMVVAISIIIVINVVSKEVVFKVVTGNVMAFVFMVVASLMVNFDKDSLNFLAVNSQFTTIITHLHTNYSFAITDNSQVSTNTTIFASTNFITFTTTTTFVSTNSTDPAYILPFLHLLPAD